MIRRFIGIKPAFMWHYVLEHDSEANRIRIIGHPNLSQNDRWRNWGPVSPLWIEEFPAGLFPGVDLPRIESSGRIKRKAMTV